MFEIIDIEKKKKLLFNFEYLKIIVSNGADILYEWLKAKIEWTDRIKVGIKKFF